MSRGRLPQIRVTRLHRHTDPVISSAQHLGIACNLRAPLRIELRDSSQRSYGSYNGALLESLAAKPVQKRLLRDSCVLSTS